jgi:hypothetical protein
VHRHWLSGLVFVTVLARASEGQAFGGVADGYVDLGGALLRQPGLVATNVLTLAGLFHYATSDFALATNGLAAKTPDDRFTGQGVLTASRYAPPTNRVRWELTGTASAFGLSNAAPVFAWQAVAREHWVGSLGGLFVGGAYGTLAQGGASSDVAGAQAGGYLRLDPAGRAELSAAVAYADAGSIANGARLRYTDAVAYWSYRARLVELSGGGGVRLGGTPGATTQGWGSGSAALWLSDRAALVFTGGNALADIARGVPSVRYLSLSMRIGANTRAAPAAVHVRQTPPDANDGRLDVRAGDDSMRLVSVRLASASLVELMADFTDWEPVTMARLPNGEWTLDRAIAPGTHRVAIRVDGGDWRVPPNLPRVADEFGGEVGIVIVP